MISVQAARQSVVNVTSLVDARGGPLGLNPMQVKQGTGSGFLWDASGHIVTNWHVRQLSLLVAATENWCCVGRHLLGVTEDQALTGVDFLQVIRNAKAARVTLWNNETYDATLQGGRC